MAHDLARDLPYLTVKAQNCECKAIEICGFDILGHEVRDVSFNKCLFRENLCIDIRKSREIHIDLKQL